MVDAWARDLGLLLVLFVIIVVVAKVLEVDCRNPVELLEHVLYALKLLGICHGKRRRFFGGHGEIHAYVQIREELEEIFLALTLASALCADSWDGQIAGKAVIFALLFGRL